MMVRGTEVKEQDFGGLATLEKLLQIGQSLIAVHDLEVLLQEIVESAGSVLCADIIVLYEYHEERDDVSVPPVIWGDIQYPQVLTDRSQRQPHKESAVFRILERAEPFYAPDAVTNWAQLIEGWSQEKSFVHRESIVSSAALPLIADGKRVGLLFVNYQSPHTFSTEEQKTIEIFATQAAVAIKTARLLADWQRQAKGHRTLNRVGTTLVDILDEDTILKTVARAVADTLGCTHCTVFRVEDSDLVVRAAEGNRDWSLPLGRAFPVGKGVAGWVAQTGNPALVRDTREDPYFAHGWSAPQPDPQSLVVVPIFLSTEVYGAISAEHDEISAFDEYDQRLLETLALQMSQAIRNARLRLDFEHQIELQETVNRVSRDLSTKLDDESIFAAVVEAVVETLKCTHCTVFILEDDWLVPRASYVRGEPIRVDRGFALGEGLAGWTAQQGISVLAADASRDEHFVKGTTRPDVERSMIVVPVRVGDRLVGVISADQHHQVNAFDDNDLKMVEILALQAGVAIQNADLLREEQQRADTMELLGQISANISATLDLQDTLDMIIEGAMRLTGMDSGVIHLVDETQQAVVHSYEIPEDFGHPSSRFSQKKGLTWTIVTEETTICVPDITKDARVHPDMFEKEVNAIIGIPLKTAGKTIGALFLNDSNPHDFTNYEIYLLATLADHAAIAIQNAQLFEEQVERASQLEQLQAVTTAISAEPADLRKVLRLIVESLRDTFPGASCSLRLYDATRDEFEPQVATGALEDLMDHPPRRDGTSHYVVTTKTPRYLEGTSLVNPADGGPAIREDIIERGIEATAYLPLVSEGDAVGVLYVDLTEPHRFSKNEMRVLELFADQAAIAVENAKLFDQLRREREERINAIREIGFGITAGIGLTEILDNLLQKTIHLMKEASVGEIWLLDEQSGKLEVRAAYGDIETEVRELDLEEGIVGWVAKSKEPQCVEKVEDDPHFKRRLAGTRSELAVPLLRGDQLIGVVNIEHPQPGAFVEEDIPLLQAIASQVVVAIENARLFEELHERATQLEKLQQVTTTITAQPTDPEGTLRLVTGQLIDIFEGASCAIRLYDPVARKFGIRIASGALEKRVKHPPRTVGGSQHIVRTKEPIYATDASHTLPNGQPVIRQEIANEGVQAVAYLPLLSEGDVTGILYVEWTTPRQFSENDKRVLELFADQASICLRNARIYHDLERRVKALQVLTEIGRTISTLGIDQILGLIYDKISDIIDLSDALFYIAFYDVQRDRVSFGLAVEQDDGNKIDEIRWGKRDGKNVPEWEPRARRDPPGLTEYVIHNKQPVLLVEDFERQARDSGIQVWPEIGRRKRPTRSWLGVPMKVKGEVVGVISIQSLERERAFDKEHLNLLDTIADQAAVAIENARLYRDLAEAQERRIEAERFAYLGQAADGIAHRINNTVALIPLCVSDIKDHLGTFDKYVEDNLDMVARNAQYVLDLAAELQRPSRPSESGEFDVNSLIEEAIGVAGIPSNIELVTQLDETLPQVQSRKLLIDVFVELITNAIEAMSERPKKALEISSRLTADGFVEVQFTDTGKGIGEEKLARLFELFYTTAEKKEPTAGVAKGFGLWWVKTFLAWQGGEISVESRVDTGTTFVVKLPAGAQ